MSPSDFVTLGIFQLGHLWPTLQHKSSRFFTYRLEELSFHRRNHCICRVQLLQQSAVAFVMAWYVDFCRKAFPRGVPCLLFHTFWAVLQELRFLALHPPALSHCSWKIPYIRLQYLPTSNYLYSSIQLLLHFLGSCTLYIMDLYINHNFSRRPCNSVPHRWLYRKAPHPEQSTLQSCIQTPALSFP